MKFLTRFLTVIVLVVVIGFGWSALSNASNPGYANFSPKSKLPHAPELNINLGSVLLSPVRWLFPLIQSQADNEQTQADLAFVETLIKPLKHIRVQIYPAQAQPEIYKNVIGECKSTLEKDGWQTLISVNEDDERVLIMSTPLDQKTVGFVVFVTSKEETVYINLSGGYNTTQLQDLIELAQQKTIL